MNYITALAEADISSVLGNGLSLSEKAFQSLQMTLMGMGTVFSVLLIIFLVVTLFRVCLEAFTTKKETKPIDIGMAEETHKAPPAKESRKSDSAVEQKSESVDDKALIAVITAAVSSYIESENDTDTNLPFRVVSFKRKSGPWNGHSR